MHSMLRDIPVIAVSSLDADTEIPKAQEKGFSGFISKPINSVKFPEQLLACINGEKVWIASRYSMPYMIIKERNSYPGKLAKFRACK